MRLVLGRATPKQGYLSNWFTMKSLIGLTMLFYRERQIHGWSRRKKEALINGNAALLPKLAVSYKRRGFDGAQPPCFDGAQPPCFDGAQSPDFDGAQSMDFDPSIDLGEEGSTS
ncbi:MAG: hypothetical protein ABS46_01020 [Cytophagaceae bacterium SCN 52-12]|nr:MAG: hypothetical protein ABS46_01020 [Cytophagaceae bacterium SCN 52-12]